MFQIGYPLGALLEDFDLDIETFHKATGVAIDKVIQDFLPQAGKGIDEYVEAALPAFGYLWVRV